jgi:SNF2 family DNA or RNA helicase/intein/homing endonuclease
MVYVFTAETLPVEQLLRQFGRPVQQQGEALYKQGLAKVEQSAVTNAVVKVEDPPRPPQQVRIFLSGTVVSHSCTCRESYGWGPCKHKAAALLALRDHLAANPPRIWQAILDKAIQPPTRRSAAPPSGNMIIFSLQTQGSTWSVTPYSLSGKLLPPDHGGDPDTIAAAVERGHLSFQLKNIRSQVTPDSYPLVASSAVAAANTIIGSGGGYGYWYASARALPAVLAMLAGALVYQGSGDDPLGGGRVFVHDQPASIALDLAREGQDLTATFTVTLDGRQISVRPGRAQIITRDPTWMLVDEQLFRLADTGVSPEIVASYPRVRIPAADEDAFLEQYLLPLSENVPVRGSAVQWEELQAEPEARLYLSEREGDLVAELRYAYGAFELPYDKALPAETVRRVAGRTALMRIKRDPAKEQAAWQEISTGYGLKRGTTPSEFLLRKNTAPADFLLREIPKLANTGLTIFGEEALTLARVNRSKPTISFNVSSGIDWFDVEAVVQFGDQMLPLKDLKRALKRRDRYVKLADGSLGMIPEEWTERYRHLFAFADDSDKGLRLANHHLTLIDDVLADADRAQADAAFHERRERLRNFERIEPVPLPAGFTGQLRDYQKAGYDWLHFLRKYGFGGCLADDMGLGKCVVGTTSIFLNGTIQAAAAIWERYAGPARSDGEGEWAEPTAPLTVNAIDEHSGRIVPAQVRRLYRQPVRELLRRVRLDDGSTITITRRHKLLGRDGWTNDLTPGDYICVPSRLAYEGEAVDPDLITLLAWQIAEGNELSERSTVRITQQNVSRLEELRATFHRIGERYGLQINRPGIVTFREKTPSLVVNSVAYQRFLEQRGYVWGHKSAQKAIPDFIMRADEAGIRLFLRHLFDAEGSVSPGSIELSSASETLIKQVSTLLRRLGIWMRLHLKRKCATNGLRITRTYHSGTIGGSAARRFAAQVGFGDPKKQARLDALCAQPCNTNVEGVPASDIVGALVAATELPVRHLGMHNTVYLNGSQQFSRASLGRVLTSIDAITSGEAERAYRTQPRSKWTSRTLAAYERLDIGQVVSERGRLARLLGQEVHYCRIEAIEEIAHDGYVYDLEVAEHHNFVAEGILCHNTIQALAFLQSLYEREPQAPATLIVMPRSLLFNWQREAAQFTPGLRVAIHADQGRATEIAEFTGQHLILTTYGVMLRDVELLRQYRFHTLILDESQAIKNPIAETSRAVRQLQGEQRIALTGTPLENSTAELWSQFAFLNPGLLGSLEYFREGFVTPIERKQDEGASQFLRRMVFPFILRRTKEQVAVDLPPRSEELLVTEMEPAQRKLYIKTRDYYRALLLGLIDEEGLDDARMKILEGLLRLRQICNHPRLVDAKAKGSSGKFELLLETLDTLRAEGHKALIFSQFVQMLTLIREALDERGIPYAYLDGSTRNRKAEVDRFQSSPDLPFFLISLKAGGVGLNLTAADYVIHVDPWWNPAVEMQATDRTHRIGQTKPVFVYKLITEGTVEEKILKLQDQKRALVSQIISAEGGVFKSLTREDIEVLFT